MGADLVGKVELGIPEDDPRNPAVIADLVGDNVGDCAGQCADLFESISAEILSAMILGGAMAKHAGLDYEMKAGFILFPLLVHSLDLLVSTISVFFVSTKKGHPSRNADYGVLEDPLNVLKRGYYVSLVLALLGLFLLFPTYVTLTSVRRKRDVDEVSETAGLVERIQDMYQVKTTIVKTQPLLNIVLLFRLLSSPRSVWSALPARWEVWQRMPASTTW